jgi:hypothetical protein
VVGTRIGVRLGRVPLWVTADAQLFRAEDPQRRVPDFRTTYLLAGVQVPFGWGSLEVGGGAAFFSYRLRDGESRPSRDVGFAAGAGVSRAISGPWRMEAGIRTANLSSGVGAYLLAVQVGYYWGFGDPASARGR